MEKKLEAFVLAKCKLLLKRLEIMGWVTHWERIHVGLFYTMWGSKIKIGKENDPDLLVFVPVDETMHIMFFEVKREEGGIQRPSQKIFENKFIGFHNVIYSLITDAKQMKTIIENVRRKSRTYGKLEEWEIIDL